MKNLCEYTWKEISQLDKEKSILFITVAPIEEHSLCLPIGTDLYEGEGWTEYAAEEIEKEGYECFKLPSFPIACASAEGFYGCIHFTPKTTYTVVKEILFNLANWKLKNIVIIASHADPIHQIAIEKACDEVNEKYGLCAVSPMGAFFSANELGLSLKKSEEVSNLENKVIDDYHAGWIETSSMLYLKNDLVKKDYKKLPDSHISEKDMMSKEKQLKAMGEYGHLGSPRLAEREIGRLLTDDTADYLKNAVKCFIERKDYEKYMHHFLYKMPFMHKAFE